MKKILYAILAIATICGFGLLTAIPASAATSCTLEGNPTFRYCGISTSIVGAEFDGTIVWHYEGDNLDAYSPEAIIHGTIYDTRDDSSCAWLRLTHYDASGTQNFTEKHFVACRGVKTGKYTIPDSEDCFNCPTDGDAGGDWYQHGSWKVFLQTSSLSQHLWTQTVDAPLPPQ